MPSCRSRTASLTAGDQDARGACFTAKPHLGAADSHAPRLDVTPAALWPARCMDRRGLSSTASVAHVLVRAAARACSPSIGGAARARDSPPASRRKSTPSARRRTLPARRSRRQRSASAGSRPRRPRRSRCRPGAVRSRPRGALAGRQLPAQVPFGHRLGPRVAVGAGVMRPVPDVDFPALRAAGMAARRAGAARPGDASARPEAVSAYITRTHLPARVTVWAGRAQHAGSCELRTSTSTGSSAAATLPMTARSYSPSGPASGSAGR